MAAFLKRISKLQHAAIFLTITLLGLGAYMVGIPFLDLMELKTIDLRFHSRDPIPAGPEIVLAVIDEKSIAAEGKWIWPRSKIADLIAKLSWAGASVIAFDIGFLEPDNRGLVETIETIQSALVRFGNSNPDVDRYLRNLKNASDNDKRLADAIRTAGAKIVLGYFFQMDPANAPQLAETELARHQENIRRSRYNLEVYSSETARTVPIVSPVYPQSNIDELSKVARYSGYFNMVPDRDGVIRWLPAVMRYRDALYAPLSLVTVGAYLGGQMAINVDDYGVRSVQVGATVIPTDEDGRILINYRGGDKTFPHIPVTDILNDRVNPGTLRNKIVMVGATAVGIYDLRVTPFSSVFPGLEIHASVVDSVLAEDFLQRPKWVALFDLAAILIAGVGMGLVLPRVSVFPGIGIGLAVFVSYILFCQFLFSSYGLVLNIVYPLSVLLTVYLGITAYRYFVETRQKRFIRNAFSTYLAPSVVKQLIEAPEHLVLGGEEREITAFFSDVQGFTSISETLTPKEIVELLNEFLTEMTNIILQNEGTVDKFEGDAIIAFFGAPNVLDDHAGRTCRSCIQMQQRLMDLRRQWKAVGKPELKMRIGLCTGPAVVGNMGSENRMDYTMMGDTVNLASRLEGVNKLYGTYTLISDSTLRAAGAGYVTREIDAVKVVGKKAPVTVHELIGFPDGVGAETLEVIQHYGKGLQAYRRRDWQRAATHLKNALVRMSEDGPSQTLLKRCAHYLNEPPPADWDGSFDIRVKY
jgi:adenylate cyclase